MDSLGQQHTKTKVLLERLPLNVNEISLVEAVKELNCRRVELEPGCVVSFSSEVAALRCKDEVTKIGFSAGVKNASVPSLLLQNLNASVKCEELSASFQSFDPKLIRLLSSASVQV